MSELDRLAAAADVPEALAAIVVVAANDADVPLRVLRGRSTKRHLVAVRRRVAALGRAHRFTLWQIGRALNRDHSTVIGLHRGAPPTGPLCGFAPLPAEASSDEQIELEFDPIAEMLRKMVADAAHRAGLPVSVFVGKSRAPALVRERRSFAQLARARGFSCPQIGQALRRHHSTIIYHTASAGEAVHG